MAEKQVCFKLEQVGDLIVRLPGEVRLDGSQRALEAKRRDML